MDKFTKLIYEKYKDLQLYTEADQTEQSALPPSIENNDTSSANTESIDDTSANTKNTQPANAEEDPFPERFVYLAGLLQKALLNKFPSLLNIQSITADNVAEVIQNMENLMKQSGMLEDINTTDANI